MTRGRFERTEEGDREGRAAAMEPPATPTALDGAPRVGNSSSAGATGVRGGTGPGVRVNIPRDEEEEANKENSERGDKERGRDVFENEEMRMT